MNITIKWVKRLQHRWYEKVFDPPLEHWDGYLANGYRIAGCVDNIGSYIASVFMPQFDGWCERSETSINDEEDFVSYTDGPDSAKAECQRAVNNWFAAI